MKENTRARSAFAIHVGNAAGAQVTVADGDRVEHALLGDMWVAGRLFGGIRHGVAISRLEMVAWLRECRSLEALRDAAGWGFGPFYVILLTAHHLHVLSSAASCGVYYTLGHEPQFSDNELSLFDHHSPSGLRAAETLRYVVDNLNLSPHHGLFEGVLRSPGATLLSFDVRTGATSTHVLMPDERASNRPTFNSLVDCCATSLAEDLRLNGRHPVVYWSGGIDGLVWIIALVKAGMPVTVIHGVDPRSSALFGPLCRAVLEHLPSTASVRIIVADRNDANEADAETTMLSGLVKSNYLRPDYRLKLADLALARECAPAANAVVIMGFGIDGLYSFRKGGEGLSSTNGGRFSFYCASLGQYRRYLGITLTLKQAFVDAWCSNHAGREKLSFRLFSDSTADTRYLASTSTCDELRKLFRTELEGRFRSITRVVTGTAGSLFGSAGRTLNTSLKLAGYFNNDAVHAVRFRDQGRFTETAYEVPYLYSPMVRFLSNRPLKLRDVFTPKSLLHDYVKANLRTSYNALLRRARREAKGSRTAALTTPRHGYQRTVRDGDRHYLAKLRAVYSRHRRYWNDFAGVPAALATFFKRLDADLMAQDQRANRPGRQLENFAHLTAWLNMNLGQSSAAEQRS